jgi:hypothetical protein
LNSASLRRMKMPGLWFVAQAAVSLNVADALSVGMR